MKPAGAKPTTQRDCKNAAESGPRSGSRALKTTNCLESVNAMAEERCGKLDSWKNSNQKHRWLAAALIDIEPRLRKLLGYLHLPKLREALMRELKLDKQERVA